MSTQIETTLVSAKGKELGTAKFTLWNSPGNSSHFIIGSVNADNVIINGKEYQNVYGYIEYSQQNEFTFSLSGYRTLTDSARGIFSDAVLTNEDIQQFLVIPSVDDLNRLALEAAKNAGHNYVTSYEHGSSRSLYDVEKTWIGAYAPITGKRSAIQYWMPTDLGAVSSGELKKAFRAGMREALEELEG